MSQLQQGNYRLVRKNGLVYARTQEGEDVQVRVLWPRPLSGRGREISLFDTNNREIALLANMEELDEESQVIAQAELERRYLVPRITKVIQASARFGSRYWHVETHLGDRRFILKNPSRNALWITGNHLILRDTVGNSYEIDPYSGLDARSLALIERVL